MLLTDGLGIQDPLANKGKRKLPFKASMMLKWIEAYVGNAYDEEYLQNYYGGLDE